MEPIKDTNLQLLTRIDERTISLQKSFEEFKETVSKNTDETKAMIQIGYVTKEEFAPIKAIVYGMVGTILLAVLTVIMGLMFFK